MKDEWDFAHGFIYGCIISLVFLLFSIIAAIKERRDNRRAEKEARQAEKSIPAVSGKAPFKLVSLAVRIDAPVSGKMY